MTDTTPVVVYVTYRAHSCGEATTSKKTIRGLEKTHEYLMKVFSGYLEVNGYPTTWDPTDMFVVPPYRGCAGKPAPAPSMEVAEELFSVKNLGRMISTCDRVLYGPWSKYEFQVPFEITIRSTR